jgi:uncharacterized protein (DUF952 family)
MEFIYHITARKTWDDSKNIGVYSSESLSSAGFIHCSKTGQILRVANSFFPNQNGLVILEIDPMRLKSSLQWEPGTDKEDELFPHIHGALNLDAVICVYEFEPDEGGEFHLPPSING